MIRNAMVFISAIVITFTSVGCSSAPAPTPVPAAAPTLAAVPTSTPAAIPPTATALSPTATLLPPTAAPLPPTAVPTLSPADAHLKGQIDPLVLAYLKDNPVTGMSVVVLIPGPDGKLAVKKFKYGTVSKTSNVPVTSSTLFEIASQSKVFTAVLLASFVNEKRINLQDPVQKYLPADIKMPSFNGVQITMQDLATHRSGLPRLPDNLGTGIGAMSKYTVQNLYDYLNSAKLARAPGAQYLYSNLAFGLLGTILATMSGTSYEDLVVQRIANPLQMPDTRITLSAAQKGREASGYYPNGKLAPDHNNNNGLAGAGGLLSNADDMAAFLLANIDLASSPLGPVFDDTHTLRPYTQEPNAKTGLGWDYAAPSSDFSYPILWKDGASEGFASWMGFVTEKKTGIEVLTNQSGEDSKFAIATDDLGKSLLKQISK